MGSLSCYSGFWASANISIGGGSGTNMGQASLPGLVNAIGFRDAVLAQRDLITDRGTALRPATPNSMPENVDTLHEIRDSLHRIEHLLGKKIGS